MKDIPLDSARMALIPTHLPQLVCRTLRLRLAGSPSEGHLLDCHPPPGGANAAKANAGVVISEAGAVGQGDVEDDVSHPQWCLLDPLHDPCVQRNGECFGLKAARDQVVPARVLAGGM